MGPGFESQPVHNLACNKQQKLRNLTKSEFFYALCGTFLYPFVLFFVARLVYFNYRIVKLLKSPNGANIGCDALIEEILIATEEILEPREVVVALRRTPIVERRKTPNSSFL